MNLDVGIIYYLYLFGRSFAWNERANYSIMLASPLIY